MRFKSFLAKPYARYSVSRLRADSLRPEAMQRQTLSKIIQKAKNTWFGKKFSFAEIRSFDDFRKSVPIQSYEGFRPAINRIIDGEKDVLWPGKPIYFAKTSGTTSGSKYIPISKDSITHHIDAARNALLSNIRERSAAFVDGKMIFLSGSPILEEKGGILTGRLSGIVNHHIPKYLQRNQMPSYETNCIEDWEHKLDKIVGETINQDMRLISGIPPWVQMYFDKLYKRSGGKTVKEIFPNLQVVVHGGVNFNPYRKKMEQSIGGKVDFVETYPASEGFYAFQDSQKEEGLLLNLDGGMFYEFVPLNEVNDEHPTRLAVWEVKKNVNYALVISSDAGLWGYLTGDTVKFVNTKPARILVTGRIKHFISAFGEHVIAEEVEGSMKQLCEEFGLSVTEFTVAPLVTPTEGLPHHEWYVEFDEMLDQNMKTILEHRLDELLCRRNSYYKDLIEGAVLSPLSIVPIRRGGFQDYMRSIGKLGGQNKVPRLSNDRKIANLLSPFTRPMLSDFDDDDNLAIWG